jgi:hypothetical protein
MKETLQNTNVLTLCPRTKAIDNHKLWPIENFVMKETLQNMNVLAIIGGWALLPIETWSLGLQVGNLWLELCAYQPWAHKAQEAHTTT